MEETVHPAEQPAKRSESSSPGVFSRLSLADRLLPVWIFISMVLGVVLGRYTDIGNLLNRSEFISVSLPVAIGLWLMMWPVLTKVRYELLGGILQSRKLWSQMGFELFMSWILGPLLMSGLAWITLPDLPSYRTGVLLVAVAPCIAMVLIWNHLAGGDPEFCAILVAVNSVLQLVLYAPLALFYVNVISRPAEGLSVSFWAVARSVLLYLGIPLIAGVVTRYAVIAMAGRDWLENKFLPYFGRLALVALVYTVFALFALQGHQVLDQIGSVARVAVPMIFFFVIMWSLTLYLTRRLGSDYPQAITQAFTASSNNFELAIAIAVGTYGVSSQEALAATIGPLIEVPALLALTYLALWLKVKIQWPRKGTVEIVDLPPHLSAAGTAEEGRQVEYVDATATSGRL